MLNASFGSLVKLQINVKLCHNALSQRSFTPHLSPSLSLRLIRQCAAATQANKKQSENEHLGPYLPTVW